MGRPMRCPLDRVFFDKPVGERSLRAWLFPRETIADALALLPLRFQWTLHDLVACPMSELLFQFGFGRAGDVVHNWTVPAHERGAGRG